MTLAPSNPELVLKSFEDIAERTDPNLNELRLEIDLDGGVSIRGYTLLHGSKLPQFVNEALERLKLVRIEGERVVRKLNQVHRLHFGRADRREPT